MGSSHWFFDCDRSAGKFSNDPLYLGYLPLFAGLRSCFDQLASFIKQPGSNWVFWPCLPPGPVGLWGCRLLEAGLGKRKGSSLRPERCTVFVASAMDFMPGSCHWKFVGGPTMPNPHAKTM